MIPNYDQWKLTAPGDDSGPIDSQDILGAVIDEAEYELATAYESFLSIQGSLEDADGFRGEYTIHDFIEDAKQAFEKRMAKREHNRKVLADAMLRGDAKGAVEALRNGD